MKALVSKTKVVCKGYWNPEWHGQDWHCQLSETTARAETQLAGRQEDVGERKQRLIGMKRGLQFFPLAGQRESWKKPPSTGTAKGLATIPLLAATGYKI